MAADGGGTPASARAAGAGTAGAATAPLTLEELGLPGIGGVSTDAAVDADAGARLFLEVWFGDRPTGRLGEFRLRDGRLHARADALRELDLVVDGAPADAGGWIALDDLPGLRHAYLPAQQRLVLHVPAALRPLQRLGDAPAGPVDARRDAGLLVNYDGYARSLGGVDTLSLSAMARLFGRWGAVEHGGVRAFGAGDAGFRRLDTRWTYGDPRTMSTWTVGDLVSGGLSWTRPVRLGGVQWRRNFGLRPDLVTYPSPAFGGEATVPSSVELLVDNVSRFSADVDQGPFVIDAFPRITGAGEATLLVRDALGRVTETSVPLYVDYQRLAPGLADFSLEAGRLRTGYAGADDGYGDTMVASASYRRGITRALTLEGHLEAGGDLRLAGAGAVWSPGPRAGVVNVAAARGGRDETSGWLRSAGYQWMSRRFGIELQAQRYGRGYRDLGALAVDDPVADGTVPFDTRPRARDRASLWMALPRGTLGYSWVRSDDFGGEADRIHALTWSRTWAHGLYAYASAFDSTRGGLGISLSLNLPLGRRRDARMSANHADGRVDATLGLRQSVPYDTGWGWDVQAGHRAGDAHGRAAATVRGLHGEATLGMDHVDGATGGFAQAAGSLVWMGGGLFASRRVQDAFAVVSTRGVPGVPVLYENRLLGTSGSDGLLLVPGLRGWQRNRLAIDPDGLGAGYRLPPLETFATPADQGAVLVTFDIARIRPARVTLLDADGAPVPAGSRGERPHGAGPFLVGLEGEAWLEDHAAGDVLSVGDCRYALPPTTGGTDGAPVRIGPLPCLEN
ncbi:fimbria/pilus outer membrane usher protein [Luteimonas pelagia]